MNEVDKAGIEENEAGWTSIVSVSIHLTTLSGVRFRIRSKGTIDVCIQGAERLLDIQSYPAPGSGYDDVPIWKG